MLSCHLCLISCYSLVFWILGFDCSFSLIAWYLYVLLLFKTRIQGRCLTNLAPRMLSHFRGGGIAYLNDTDSYAG